jgi:predicted transcriptional regulator
MEVENMDEDTIDNKDSKKVTTPVTTKSLHEPHGNMVTTPVTTSIGISLLNSEPNNNNTNNNNTKIEVVTDPVTLLPQNHFMEPVVTEDVTMLPNNVLKYRPTVFWILHLFSVEGKTELTSTTITKLLKERYGLDIDDKAVMAALQRLVKKGVLKRRKPFHINASGRGGVRKVYYYSYVSLEKLCQEMAKYDNQAAFNVAQHKFDEIVIEILKNDCAFKEKLVAILNEQNRFLEQLARTISEVMMKLDLR